MTHSAILVALLAALAVVVAASPAARVLVAPRHRLTVQTNPSPSWWRAVTRRRRTPPPPTDAEMAAWCDQVASALRSGRSLTAAITETDAAWRPRAVLPSVGQAIRRGRALSDALAGAGADPATPRGLAVPVLTASARLGGPAAPVVERVASTLRARDAEHAERHAASAQARLSARVLTVLPFAVLAFLALTEPAVRDAASSPLGLTCLVLGAALNAIGWGWMRRLIGARR
jgi:tight adherence protein B